MANDEEARRKKYIISMLMVNSGVGQTFKEKKYSTATVHHSMICSQSSLLP